MDNTITALKALYVALGGSAETVANIVIIPDMINAIATQVASLSLTSELPADPSANGTYVLQAVKNNSGTTKSWASATQG